MEEKTQQPLDTINVPAEFLETRGSIDAIDAGVAYGWVAYEKNDEPLTVYVVAEDRVLGSGEANLFRQDLLEAKIGNGRHGFEIDVNSLPVNDGREVTYKLVNAKTGQDIRNVSYVKRQLNQSISAEILREEHGHLVIKLRSDKPISDKRVNVFHEDKLLATQDISTEHEDIQVRIALPIEVIDGHPRLFKVGLAGIKEVMTASTLAVHPVQTPWQYIKESFNKPGFLSMPKQADKRYESLHFQLEDMAHGRSSLQASDLATVHNVIVEGYEGRTHYPKFNLPVWDEPEVSVIVPAYNKFELSYHCIASIALAYNKTSYEVILADDCSTDETAYAEDIIGNLVVSRNEENLRFLRSCNQATDLAKGKYIIFLNNDTEVTSYWIDELVARMEENPTVGIAGSKLLNLDGSMQEAGGIIWGNGQAWNVGREINPLTPEYNYVREVDYLTGAALCIRHDLWQQVGKFSDEFAPCYYEDTDLAFKVRAAGYKTIYVPHSEVVHFEGQSHGTDVTQGLKRYQLINEGAFRQKWLKEYRSNGTPSFANLRYEKDRNIDQRVLVIDYASPTPNKDAGSYAAIQEMKLIQSLGFKVTFVPANMAHFGKYTTELQKMGVEVLYAPFYHSVNHVLETRLDEFDAVYITRYHIAKDYVSYIRQHSNAKIIFNNADLHFLRELRAALRDGGDPEQIERALQTREDELAVCGQVDAVLCYNSTEHAVITSHILEADKLHITPWVLQQKSQGPAFEQREGLVFLGGFNHLPNIEAVEYLANDIMPLLAAQRPDIKLYIYGSNMPAHLKQLATDNIKMVGFAESLDDVYHNHRVFVAPLLSGAGIKGKVVESMAYNLPAVLTDIAAEGIGLTHGISTLIAQEPQEWVDAMIKLYDDKALWTKFAENSQLIVDAKYSFQHGHKVFKDIFASVGVYSTK
ncbi:TPA: glycosyltransferase [Vibrio parahaemolyticus]|nr:glycosyltransferase [Vibrio parahaemolyticus]